MNISLNGIIIIVGNYGSGKTEVTINLAIDSREKGMEVAVADLDLVNPYFRIRESVKQLSKLGIKSVIPQDKYLNADLPILTPKVAGLIRKPSSLTLLDAGGDDAGVVVLSALADAMQNKDIKVIQVINPFRPFTKNIDGCLKICKEIEKASRLKVTSIAGNANLMNETRTEHIYNGYEFVKTLSEKSNMQLEFITAAIDLLPELNTSRFACPVLGIRIWKEN